MLTIKAMVKKDSMRVDRNYNVKLSFTYKRKVKRLSTSLFVSADELTKSLTFKEGADIKRKVDKLVESYRNKCDQLQVDANNYTLDEIMEKLNADEDERNLLTLFSFASRILDFLFLQFHHSIV